MYLCQNRIACLFFVSFFHVSLCIVCIFNFANVGQSKRDEVFVCCCSITFSSVFLRLLFSIRIWKTSPNHITKCRTHSQTPFKHMQYGWLEREGGNEHFVSFLNTCKYKSVWYCRSTSSKWNKAKASFVLKTQVKKWLTTAHCSLPFARIVF